MQFTQATLLAVLAATTSAAITHVDVLKTLHINSPVAGVSLNANKGAPAALLKRWDEEECYDSAMSLLKSIPTAASEVESWALTADIEDSCTLTAPASMSSDVIAYITEIAEWVEKAEKDAQEIIDECSMEDVPVTGAVCESASVIFTEGSSTATVVDLASVLPEADDAEAGASGVQNMVAAGAALFAGAAGVVLVL